MKPTTETTRLWPRIKWRIAANYRNNSNVVDQCALMNMKRAYYLALVAAPLHTLYAILLTLNNSTSCKIWCQGIVASHLGIVIFFVGVLVCTYFFRRQAQANTAMHVLQYIAPTVIIIFGAIIAAIDQLITTNTAPFLLGCVAAGAVFLLRPMASFIIYFAGYLLYYHLMALTITDPQLLLSSRINGIASVGIGFAISIIIWQHNYTNITQGRHIEQQQQQLKQLAYYDPLTHIPNRHFFNQIIDEEFSAMQQHQHQSVIIILDLDDFKNINDTYGHLVGDQVLKQLAQLLKDNIRESDTISRFGGEEFVILVPKVSLDEGFAFAQRLRKLIQHHTFNFNSIPLKITASFGVSLLQHTETMGTDNYFSLADKALYQAKELGKNKVVKA